MIFKLATVNDNVNEERFYCVHPGLSVVMSDMTEAYERKRIKQSGDLAVRFSGHQSSPTKLRRSGRSDKASPA